jgi:hypothetical protein
MVSEQPGSSLEVLTREGVKLLAKSSPRVVRMFAVLSIRNNSAQKVWPDERILVSQKTVFEGEETISNKVHVSCANNCRMCPRRSS